jgi:hypothetical protein
VVAAVLLVVVLVRTRIEAMNELMATKRIELERCENILASRSGLENVNQTLKRTLTSDEGRFLLRGGTPELVAAKIQSQLIKAAQDSGIRIDNIRYASQGQRKGYKVLSLELTMTTDLEGLLKICELIGSYEEFLFISRAQVTVAHRGDQRVLTSKVGISGLMGPYEPQKSPKTKGDSQ